MALIQCPECGREKVSSQADKCPDCGFPIKEYYEKKQEEPPNDGCDDSSENTLICPECGKEKISNQVDTCPDCGFPIKEFYESHQEVIELVEKIIPCDFNVQIPRVKVCVKCGNVAIDIPNYRHCGCELDGTQYPTVEVDYPEKQLLDMNGDVGCFIYIRESCVIPRNIGDIDSPEYQKVTEELNQKITQESIEWHKCPCAVPPEPKYLIDSNRSLPYFQSQEQMSTHMPKCPGCGSTKVKKISMGSRVAHGAAFGLFSKTARSQFECENCGLKF